MVVNIYISDTFYINVARARTEWWYDMRIEEVIEKDPESHIIKLYNKASKFIWTSTNLYPEFYNKPNVAEAIKKAAERVENFFLLHDSSLIDWDEIKTQVTWISELIEKGKVIVRKSTARLRHWLIIDGSHFRLAKEQLGTTSTPKNLIVWNAAKPTADYLIDIFAGWWRSATPIG